MVERVFAVSFWFSILPVFVVPVIHHRYQTTNQDARDVYYNDNGVGLFPPIFNLAKHSDISVNATCGTDRPEVFCRRPLDKEGRKSNHCKPMLCDAKKNNIRRAIDGSKESWISPTLENGMEYEYVTILLDMKQIYQVAYVTLKAGIAPRPAAWVLERSTDGLDFSPWQYFADSDAECRKRFGLPATQGKPHYKTDDEVICTIYYSKLFPLENGEVHVSLLNGRPSLNTSSDLLKNFTLARYVRIRLQKMHKTDKDLALRKRLFYSIKTISIGGQCLCNGHAPKCTPNSISGIPSCECEHHTCGKSCNECCPMFNQQPWSPGTSETAGVCEACQCYGHAVACRYSSEVAAAKLSLDTKGQYRGGGECLNCTAHTTGVNCERCEKGWYRPLGIRPDDASPCVPCECHPRGSTGSCAYDDSQPGKPAGWCECKEGFAGIKCDKCVPGRRNFPICEVCPCDQSGSHRTDDCSGPCMCKANVEGENCDNCKPGFFALSEKNPEGCTKCYCSGVTDVCEQANLTPNVTESSLDGWLVTDLSTTRKIMPTQDPDTNTLYVGNYEFSGVESYYWQAPSSFCGNKLSSYGEMTITFMVGWEAMRGDTSGQPTVGPNIILIGSNGVRLGHGEQIFEGRKGNTTLSAPLIEDAWYIIPPDVKDIRTRLRRTEYRGAAITRDQLLSVLADLKHVLLRAKFHTDQAEGSLLSVKLEHGITDPNTKDHFLERCSCPPEYAGLSCESCAFSYYKDTNSTIDGPFKCLPCPCNGHSECDSESGVCKKCEHNTEGDECDVCLDGYYGNPSMGTPEDCKPCACPLSNPENNFSPFCELKDSENGTSEDYVCTSCPLGHAGDHCERCADGYYGNPLEYGGGCKFCDCKGGPCNNLTGECLECKGNTEGLHCEKCKPLHFGNPLESDCKPCDCSLGGSEGETCDEITGQCPCRSSYTGRTCNQCNEGFGNVTAGCLKCDCGVGSKNEICDPVTGECDCQIGAVSPKCDQCEPLHFGLSSEGCQGCGCHIIGSQQTACDIVSGQCQCKPNVTGRACDQCEDEHWGLSTGGGCFPCDCDAIGSMTTTCDLDTGQCVCKPGIGGRNCDGCLPNYFGFSLSGCLKCQECNLLGHICDPNTGRCVCPPHTQGVHCHICAQNAWGYQKSKGCLPCNCDSGGSSKSQCDPFTGKCTCRKGFRGERCDSCDHGYYGYPFCKSCECDFAGTDEKVCDPLSEKCQCDENGTCPCKQNVMGKKCDACKKGTFGLQADNPNGCTACFCFGRSASCTQAGLHWSQIRSNRPRSVSIEYDPSPPFKNTLPIDTQEICYINLAIPGGGEVTLNGADRGLNVTNNLRTIPGDTEDVKIGVSFLFDTPVYWKLPQQFLGDKILSYGGYLRFVVETEGGLTQLPPLVLASYPLVQLQGNSKIVLEYFPLFPSPSGRYEVRFHESLWREKAHPDRKVSRETMMLALQNVQHILIRASDAVDFTKVVLRNVSMDTAAASTGLALAGGIELCECPPEYNSTSCQDPSIGFYRWYDKNVHRATIVIQLIGEAKPCECNNRSRICDIETGYCRNCSYNTGGPHCDRCGEGHYGDPSISPCLSCPCPRPDRNFATSCQVLPGRDPVCVCKEGYTGKNCDRCAYGWFGYPEEEGGFCRPCECDPYGSVSDECHEKTGQCNCRPGIEGRDCSICPWREVMTPKGCSTCEDGCTGILLKDFDNLTARLQNETIHALKNAGPPWKKLRNVENILNHVDYALTKWEDTSKEVENILDDNTPHRLKGRAKALLQEARDVEARCTEARNDAFLIKNEAEDALNKILETKNDIQKITSNLENYSGGDKGTVNDVTALMEAKRLLDKIAARDFKQQKQEAERVLDYCTGILNKTLHMNGGFPEMRDMRDRLRTLLVKLEELQNLTKKTKDLSDKRQIQAKENRRRLKHLLKKIEHINAGLEEVEEIREEADDMLYDADQFLTDAKETLKNLTAVSHRLKNSTMALEKREKILYDLNPLYRSKYVKPSQEHADYLMRLATEYRDLLNTTKKDAGLAIEASKSYQDIVDDLGAAREIAESAKVSADVSYEEVFPERNEDSIMERASLSKSVSSRLMGRGINQVDQGLDLRRKLDLEKNAVNKLEETVRETGVADNNLVKGLQQYEDLRVRENIQNAMSSLDNIETQMEEAKGSVEEINKDISDRLRPQLANLAMESGKFNLEKAHSNIQESLRTNRRTIALLNKMNEDFEQRKQRGYFQNTNNSLANTLMNLKNKITEARHAAQSIRLSLSSNSTRGCVRSFKMGTHEPTTTTRLVVTMTVDHSARNGIIFYLPSSSTADFIALEIVDGNVRFVWNNGGGPGVVWKSLKSVSGPNKKEGSQWYKIIVERISYTAKLWVLPDGIFSSDSHPATNASSPNFGRLDIGPDDKIWIGGLPSDIERPSEILTLQQGLIGCLHSVTLDDRPLGLWEYFTDTTDSCSACEKGIDEVIDDSAYNFNGEGYSVLKHQSKSIYNKYQFSVALKFKTYDDNAILFLAFPSVEKDRYVSLTLRDGRVVFQIAYGAESQLEMSSSKTYNDGNWTIVEASRNFDRRRKIENGLLKVGDEMKVAAPPIPPSQTQIPDLAGADYLVGGFPPGYNFKSAHLRLPKSFLGCMADLFIDKEIYNPLRGRSHGVGSSCSETVVKVAGFRGEGYLKLEASRLKKDSAFGLAIRTLQADAFVLLANGKSSSFENGDLEDDTPNDIETGLSDDSKKRESYYSVSLVDGRIEVRIDAGKGAVTLVSQTLCNDGRFHSIFVTKTGRKLELRVDDELQASSTLPNGAIAVKAKDLYLGGVARGIDVSLYASGYTPFIGTIKDVLFNYMLMKFDHPLEFQNVDLGRLGPEKGEYSSIMSMARVVPAIHSECHRSRKYVLDPKAVKFGDSPNSHVQINLRRRNVFHKNFNIELDFRTFYKNGLLLMIPSGEGREHKQEESTKKSKQKNFLVLILRNGLLQIIVRAKKKLELSSSKTFDDGNWHRVLISREERKLLMLIDSGDPGRLRLPKKINLGNSIYVGGLPEKSLIPEHSLAKLDGFTGCLRNLKISNQTEDLIGEKALHQRVGQCFPQVEKGSYFSGDAFAIYKKEFKTEDLLNIELEFRTSEINGILLSIARSQGYPAFSIEINNGKIIMLGDTGDRRQFRIEHSFPTNFTVCDNKWHRIHTIYEKNEIIMRVDQTDNKKELFRNNYFLNSVVNAPMYIGGLPEHLPGSIPELETKDNFKGCIRSLVIGGEKKDFTEMQTRHNVLIGSCPTVSQH